MVKTLKATGGRHPFGIAFDPEGDRLAVAYADTMAVDIVDDWRERMPVVRPIIAETQMRNAGLTRGQVASAQPK